MAKVEVFTQPSCGACGELKRLLREAGIELIEHDVTTLDGRVVAAWHGSPTILPAVAVDGEPLFEAGDAQAVLAAVNKCVAEAAHGDS